MFFGKSRIRQNVFLGLIHHSRELREAIPETVSHSPPPLVSTLSIGLGEDGTDRGSDLLLGLLGDLGKSVPHKMNPATLPARSLQNGLYGRLHPLMGVVGYQPYSRKTASYQRT